MNSLREALDDSPENLPLRLVYARRCEETLAWHEACAIYEDVLDKFPTNASAHLGIARALFFQGKISEAEVRAEGLLHNHPKFAEGHLFLSKLLCSDGDIDRAADHYSIALSIDSCLAEPALDRDLGDAIRRSEEEEHAGDETYVESSAQDPFESDDWLTSGEDESVDSPFELGEAADKDASGYVDGGFMDALQHGLEQNGMKVTDLDIPPISFSDVGGMDSLKEDLRMKIVHPIKNPQLFNSYGIKAGGSFLLYGPPGCGKSMIGRSLDGEVNTSFYTLGLHELLEAGIGRAEKQLHEIFHIAKMNAPSVLFLDEVDSIAGSRTAGDLGRSSIVNQLLKELDDVSRCADGVLVVAATSAPWLLDPAFHSAGRFGSKVCVAPPSELERVDIIRVLRNRIPVSDLDAAKIATATEGFSGAELTAVFENAAERAIASSITIGCYQALTTALILEEAERMTPASDAWVSMARKEIEIARVRDVFKELFE